MRETNAPDSDLSEEVFGREDMLSRIEKRCWWTLVQEHVPPSSGLTFTLVNDKDHRTDATRRFEQRQQSSNTSKIRAQNIVPYYLHIMALLVVF